MKGRPGRPLGLGPRWTGGATASEEAAWTWEGPGGGCGSPGAVRRDRGTRTGEVDEAGAGGREEVVFMCGGAGAPGRKEGAQAHMRQELGRLTSHLVPARVSWEAGSEGGGPQVGRPTAVDGERDTEGPGEASSHSPRRGLRRGGE